MSDLCAICRGSGGAVTFRPMAFWTCLYCGGSGARVQYGPTKFAERR